MEDDLVNKLLCPKHGIVASYHRLPPTAPEKCPVLNEEYQRCNRQLTQVVPHA